MRFVFVLCAKHADTERSVNRKMLQELPYDIWILFVHKFAFLELSVELRFLIIIFKHFVIRAETKKRSPMVEQSSITTPAYLSQNKEPLNGMSTSTEHIPSSPTAATDDVDAESNKRSERKRRREKQRRSDLSNAFDELAAFIFQVEPGSEDDRDKKGKKRKTSDGGEDSAGITRLDLIGRALRIMKRLYRENEERKRVIATIEGRGGGANDNVSEMDYAYRREKDSER